MPADAIAPLKSKRMFWMPLEPRAGGSRYRNRLLQNPVARCRDRCRPRDQSGIRAWASRGRCLQALSVMRCSRALSMTAMFRRMETPWSYRAPLRHRSARAIHLASSKNTGWGRGRLAPKGIWRSAVLGIAAAVANAATGRRRRSHHDVTDHTREKSCARCVNGMHRGTTRKKARRQEFHTLHQPEVSL